MNVRLTQGASPNTTLVHVGPLTLVFSYTTCVAFSIPGEGWVVSENVWSQTTGKHLNQNTPEGAERIPYEEFEQRLDRVLNTIEMKNPVWRK